MATTVKVKDEKVPLLIKLPVGSIAGVIGTTTIYPLDFVKTQLQKKKGLYNGPIDCARKVYAAGGPLAFYDGLRLNLFGVVFEKALKLAVNEYVKEQFEDENGKVALKHEMLAGATAGCIQAVFTNPMEVSKIWMQVQNEKPPAERLSSMGVLKALRLKGLYMATHASIARDVPFSIIFFPLYSNLREAMAKTNPTTGEKTNSLMDNIVCGTVAGSIGAGLVTPFDMLKTRLQKPGGLAVYKNLFHAFKVVTQQEGYKVLYSGATPRMIVVGPLFGVTMLCFEQLKVWYNQNKNNYDFLKRFQTNK